MITDKLGEEVIKETSQALKKNRIYDNIIQLLKEHKDGLSIAEISRKIKINRSTLRYYLKDLKADGYIFDKKSSNLQGNPTLLFLNLDRLKKDWNNLIKKAKEQEKELLASKGMKEIIDLFKKSKNQKMTEEEFFRKIKEIDTSNPYSVESNLLECFWYLKSNGDIKIEYTLNRGKGKKKKA